MAVTGGRRVIADSMFRATDAFVQFDPAGSGGELKKARKGLKGKDDERAIATIMQANAVIGCTAKQQAMRKKSCTMVRAKEFMGASTDDADSVADALQRARKACPCSMDVDEEGRNVFFVSEDAFAEEQLKISPEMAASVLLGGMKTIAEGSLNAGVDGAVVAVPLRWAEAQRTSLKKAAELCGLTLLQAIPEPIAIAIAHGLDQPAPMRSDLALIVDVGEQNMQLTVIAARSGMMSIKCSHVEDGVGGRVLDESLIEFARGNLSVRLVA